MADLSGDRGGLIAAYNLANQLNLACAKTYREIRW
jgi:hypothetical protein